MIMANGMGSPQGLPNKQRELMLTGGEGAGPDCCSGCTEGPATALSGSPLPRIRASEKEALGTEAGGDPLIRSVQGEPEEGGRAFSDSGPWEVTGDGEDISMEADTKEGKLTHITIEVPQGVV